MSNVACIKINIEFYSGFKILIIKCIFGGKSIEEFISPARYV